MASKSSAAVSKNSTAKKTAGKSTAGKSGRKSGGASNKSSSGSVSSRGAKTGSGRKSAAGTRKKESSVIANDIKIIAFLTVAVILTLSNFSLCGTLGDTVSHFLFGIFGITAYIVPAGAFIAVMFFAANISSKTAMKKLIAAFVLFLMVCTMLQLWASGTTHGLIREESFYRLCAEKRTGGGAVGGAIASLFCMTVGIYGAYIVTIAIILVTMVVITNKSLINGVKNQSRRMYDNARDDFEKMKENSANRLARKERNKMTRAGKKVRGVNLSRITTPDQPDGDIHELIQSGTVFRGHVEIAEDVLTEEAGPEPESLWKVNTAEPEIPEMDSVGYDNQEQELPKSEPDIGRNMNVALTEPEEDRTEEIQNGEFQPKERIQVSKSAMEVMNRKAFSSAASVSNARAVPDVSTGVTDGPVPSAKPVKSKEYVMPPLSLLKKGSGKKMGNGRVKGMSATARKLQETLNAFGVKANVVDESRGPSVTRYELQPETGTKVSRITSLADDIKLNLAASDIRIEAPIPGKAAVGIEVPNDVRESVFLRDLIESMELKQHSSKIAFAAGMDIAGNVVVADIAKMPHMLIAGTTGSGKSVFTNSIIMSILFRAKPEEVKLIIVDPKVVEFGVYNGIPHLMTPVVTDPRKAAGALNWAVAEMQKRYQLFAQYNVRDLKGYNEKIKQMGYKDGEEELKPKEQIVIIIDELADLMMVAAKDVEGAICRLAQLARAAGIHLIIATQRPSVDVVTGLIKANIPSRVALLVSSGTDSRTIIDCNGGEKLLGNGDMLFYPSGYVKPVRLQGAFVSDKEVSDVVDFLIKNNQDVQYDEEITNTELAPEAGEPAAGAGGSDDGRDVLFAEAGRFVIEKEKGSTSMLQRMFKIGFNRAARIIDQLEQAGVVGSDEGTKPRKVLMTLEEFEQILNG
ncbi:MAG: DNA translocase FtsK [Lachnospiraceae bacterium]|nr:DNA translocase FtsK [Lachnospiraceae bacterium]